VHIGGTNGKGSAAVLVAETLRIHGCRVGLYTSPHLVTIRERMVVDGRPIPAAAFAAWTERLLPHLDATGASFFEATTAIAFADFAARQVDVAVIEVGLGGRLDATNVLTPLVSAVTHVALDHTDYLGPTLEHVAREKAGIAKAGVPFVIGEPDAAAAALLRVTAREAGAVPVIVPPAARYAGALGLRGPHQRRNAAVAEAILGALPEPWRPTAETVAVGFGRARLPGRYERRGPWLFDVAHNPDGMRALRAALAADAPRPPVHALVCVLGDKDWRAMLGTLRDAVDTLWLTAAPSVPTGRAWDLAAVERFAGSAARVEPDFDRALAGVPAGAGTVLVCGSFHTVGDAMARLPGFAPVG
jgi:dihydrofolate synthase / folylpolyglutamate synthase